MSDRIKFTVTVELAPHAVIAGLPVYVDRRMPRGELRFVQSGAVVGVIRGIR